LKLYIQGCNPDCTHLFVHASIRMVRENTESDRIEFQPGTRYGEQIALIPERFNDGEMFVFANLKIIGQQFMLMKNNGRRILEIEKHCRLALSELLEIAYVRARSGGASLRSRAKARWVNRGWRKASRQRISEVWLCLANIELLRREWDELRLKFEESAEEGGRGRIFERDHSGEVGAVGNLDLNLISGSAQEAAERLDNRALLVVTGVAAVSGALGGAVVAGLFA
jgi:hypothetical protein